MHLDEKSHINTWAWFVFVCSLFTLLLPGRNVTTGITVCFEYI
jgi:hypothetical protein